MRTFKQFVPYSAIVFGGLGIALMIVPVADPSIVSHTASQSLMSWGGVCSLLGVITGVALHVRRTEPRWAATLGLVISIIPLILFTILVIALIAMAHDA